MAREKKQKKKQIVNSEKRKRKEAPNKSNFLGEVSQTFKKETKASRVGAFKKGSKGQKKATSKREKGKRKKEKSD